MNRVRSAYGFAMMFIFIISLHPVLAIHAQGQQSDDKIIIKIINDLKDEPLNINFWEKIVKHPSYHLLRDQGPQVFASLGLHSVLNQKKTPVHDGFLQGNPAKVEEVDNLWKSFLAMYDSLKERNLGGHQSDDHKESKKLSPAIRILKIAKKFEREKALDENADSSKEVKAAQNLQLDILSTGGTFGVNFNRPISAVEAGSIVKSLRVLGESIVKPKVQPVDNLLHEFTIKLASMNPSEVNQAVSDFIKRHNSEFKEVVTDENMLDSLYRYMLRPVLLDAAHEITSRLFKSLSNLGPVQQAVLKDHQTNCAVIALYHVFSALGAFSEIDEVLASRIGGKNSEERYDEVMAMVGYSPSEGDPEISKDDIDDILNLDDEFLNLDAISSMH